MNGDILFRTMPIGGFNKEDVLKYINGLQDQISDYKKEASKKDRMLQDARRRENALHAQLEDYSNKADEYFALSEEYKSRIAKNEQKIASLEKTISTIEFDFERTKDVEGQIGALVIDALLYSDKIIQSAKSSASEISSDTKATIERAVNGVDEIGNDISDISENFADVIDSLSQKLNELSSSLSGAAGTLDDAQEKAQEDRYIFGESSDIRMPKLSEKDFGSEQSDEDDISQEEIDELLERLNITLQQNVEDDACTEPDNELDEILVPVEIEEIEIETEHDDKQSDSEKETPDYRNMDIDDILNDVGGYESNNQKETVYRPSEFEIADADSDGMLNEDISKLMDEFLNSDK